MSLRLVEISTECKGSNIDTAAPLPESKAASGIAKGDVVIFPTTSADGVKGVRVHGNDRQTHVSMMIGNGSPDQILNVYAPSGGTINGAAVDTAFRSLPGRGVTLVCLNGAENKWLAF